MSVRNQTAAALALLVLSFTLLYADVASKLVRDWASDDNYSHGFLILPIALFLTWERRHKLAALPYRPHLLGLGIVCFSVCVLVAGVLGADLFLTRISLIGVTAVSVVHVLGWSHLRVLAFPIGFLLLMIPLPAIIFNQIAFPLQLLASRAGEVTLEAARIPVLREGNVIVLAHTTLEVAEACSGIRSLISLLTLGVIFGYFIDHRPGVRLAIAASTIPIAVLANGFRVAGTGIAAHYYGPAAAQGFFHTFSGWLVFVLALAMLLVVQRLMQKFLPLTARPVATGAVHAIAPIS